MANIPNTEYITVNAKGIFVGGKPATTYRGEKICDIDCVERVFAWVQEQNPNIAEFHIGAFVTPGKRAKPGNPDGAFGPNAWCRVKYKNGKFGAWVFNLTDYSAALCAYYCASICALFVRNYASFRSAVFGLIDTKNTKPVLPLEKKSQNPELKKLEQVDFSKLPKEPIELNGYRILVEKISTRTK
ncbi:MAG: hypothetical protein J6W41_04260 [Alphaproteobacteria bacterium]|nr:hypothetical protein [Alphaproteobacteria bacterium]